MDPITLPDVDATIIVVPHEILLLHGLRFDERIQAQDAANRIGEVTRESEFSSGLAPVCLTEDALARLRAECALDRIQSDSELYEYLARNANFTANDVIVSADPNINIVTQIQGINPALLGHIAVPAAQRELSRVLSHFANVQRPFAELDRFGQIAVNVFSSYGQPAAGDLTSGNALLQGKIEFEQGLSTLLATAYRFFRAYIDPADVRPFDEFLYREFGNGTAGNNIVPSLFGCTYRLVRDEETNKVLDEYYVQTNIQQRNINEIVAPERLPSELLSYEELDREARDAVRNLYEQSPLYKVTGVDGKPLASIPGIRLGFYTIPSFREIYSSRIFGPLFVSIWAYMKLFIIQMIFALYDPREVEREARRQLDRERRQSKLPRREGESDKAYKERTELNRKENEKVEAYNERLNKRLAEIVYRIAARDLAVGHRVARLAYHGTGSRRVWHIGPPELPFGERTENRISGWRLGAREILGGSSAHFGSGWRGLIGLFSGSFRFLRSWIWGDFDISSGRLPPGRIVDQMMEVEGRTSENDMFADMFQALIDLCSESGILLDEIYMYTADDSGVSRMPVIGDRNILLTVSVQDPRFKGLHTGQNTFEHMLVLLRNRFPFSAGLNFRIKTYSGIFDRDEDRPDFRKSAPKVPVYHSCRVDPYDYYVKRHSGFNPLVQAHQRAYSDWLIANTYIEPSTDTLNEMLKGNEAIGGEAPDQGRGTILAHRAAETIRGPQPTEQPTFSRTYGAELQAEVIEPLHDMARACNDLNMNDLFDHFGNDIDTFLDAISSPGADPASPHAQYRAFLENRIAAAEREAGGRQALLRATRGQDITPVGLYRNMGIILTPRDILERINLSSTAIETGHVEFMNPNAISDALLIAWNGFVDSFTDMKPEDRAAWVAMINVMYSMQAGEETEITPITEADLEEAVRDRHAVTVDEDGVIATTTTTTGAATVLPFLIFALLQDVERQSFNLLSDDMKTMCYLFSPVPLLQRFGFYDTIQYWTSVGPLPIAPGKLLMRIPLVPRPLVPTQLTVPGEKLPLTTIRLYAGMSPLASPMSGLNKTLESYMSRGFGQLVEDTFIGLYIGASPEADPVVPGSSLNRKVMFRMAFEKLHRNTNSVTRAFANMLVTRGIEQTLAGMGTSPDAAILNRNRAVRPAIPSAELQGLLDTLDPRVIPRLANRIRVIRKIVSLGDPAAIPALERVVNDDRSTAVKDEARQAIAVLQAAPVATSFASLYRDVLALQSVQAWGDECAMGTDSASGWVNYLFFANTLQRMYGDIVSGFVPGLGRAYRMGMVWRNLAENIPSFGPMHDLIRLVAARQANVDGTGQNWPLDPMIVFSFAREYPEAEVVAAAVAIHNEDQAALRLLRAANPDVERRARELITSITHNVRGVQLSEFITRNLRPFYNTWQRTPAVNKFWRDFQKEFEILDVRIIMFTPEAAAQMSLYEEAAAPEEGAAEIALEEAAAPEEGAPTVAQPPAPVQTRRGFLRPTWSWLTRAIFRASPRLQGAVSGALYAFGRAIHWPLTLYFNLIDLFSQPGKFIVGATFAIVGIVIIVGSFGALGCWVVGIILGKLGLAVASGMVMQAVAGILFVMKVTFAIVAVPFVKIWGFPISIPYVGGFLAGFIKLTAGLTFITSFYRSAGYVSREIFLPGGMWVVYHFILRPYRYLAATVISPPRAVSSAEEALKRRGIVIAADRETAMKQVRVRQVVVLNPIFVFFFTWSALSHFGLLLIPAAFMALVAGLVVGSLYMLGTSSPRLRAFSAVATIITAAATIMAIAGLGLLPPLALIYKALSFLIMLGSLMRIFIEVRYNLRNAADRKATNRIIAVAFFATVVLAFMITFYLLSPMGDQLSNLDSLQRVSDTARNWPHIVGFLYNAGAAILKALWKGLPFLVGLITIYATASAGLFNNNNRIVRGVGCLLLIGAVLGILLIHPATAAATAGFLVKLIGAAWVKTAFISLGAALKAAWLWILPHSLWGWIKATLLVLIGVPVILNIDIILRALLWRPFLRIGEFIAGASRAGGEVYRMMFGGPMVPRPEPEEEETRTTGIKMKREAGVTPELMSRVEVTDMILGTETGLESGIVARLRQMYPYLDQATVLSRARAARAVIADTIANFPELAGELLQVEFYAGNEHLAHVGDNTIYIDVDLLATYSSDLIAKEIEEELWHMLLRKLVKAGVIDQAPPAIEEIILDIAKIDAFQALPPARQAAYLITLAGDNDFDDQEFYRLLLGSLTAPRKEEIIALISAEHPEIAEKIRQSHSYVNRGILISEAIDYAKREGVYDEVTIRQYLAGRNAEDIKREMAPWLGVIESVMKEHARMELEKRYPGVTFLDPLGARLNIDPTVKIGEGAVIHTGVEIRGESVIGKGTVVYPGVKIRGKCGIGERNIIYAGVEIVGESVIGSDCQLNTVRIENSTLDDGVFVQYSAIINSSVGLGSELTMMEVQNSKIGKFATAIGGELRNSTVGDNCTLRFAAEVYDSEIGNNVTIGSRIKDAKVGDGVVSEHYSAVIEGANFPNSYPVVSFSLIERDAEGKIEKVVLGEEGVFENIPNLTNIGGGTTIKGRASLRTAFTAINSTIEGDVTIHFAGFVKGRISGSDISEVMPFSLVQGTEAGLQHRIGFILLDEASGGKPGILMNFINKTQKLLPEGRKNDIYRLIQGSIGLGLAMIRKELTKGPRDEGGASIYTRQELERGKAVYLAALNNPEWQVPGEEIVKPAAPKAQAEPEAEAALELPPVLPTIAQITDEKGTEYVKQKWPGVEFTDPSSTVVDETAEIGEGTIIGANVLLFAGTIIGAGCNISASTIIDSTVGDNTVIKDSIVITTDTVEGWKFVEKTTAATEPHASLRRFNVKIARAVIGKGVKLTDVLLINSEIGDMTVAERSQITHSKIGAHNELLPGANVEKSVTADHCLISSEVSKSWFGAGVTDDSRQVYASVIAPDGYVIVDEQGNRSVLTELANPITISGRTIFANYGGELGPDGASLKGTAFAFAAIIDPDTNVINLYDHPDISMLDLPEQTGVTVFMPFSHVSEEVWGIVLPGTIANTLSPRQHRIGAVFDEEPESVRLMVERIVDLLPAGEKNRADKLVEGSLRLGIQLVQREIDIIRGQLAGELSDANRTKLEGRLAQLERGLEIYTRNLESGRWKMNNGKWVNPAQVFGPEINTRLGVIKGKMVGTDGMRGKILTPAEAIGRRNVMAGPVREGKIGPEEPGDSELLIRYGLMTHEQAFYHGQAYVRTFGRETPFMLGGDNRPSTIELIEKLAEGIVSQGGTVYIVREPIPTPVLAYESNAKRFIGITVTGSHLGWKENGIKGFIAGKKIPDAKTVELEQNTYMISQGIAIPGIVAGGAINEMTEAGQAYVDHFLERFRQEMGGQAMPFEGKTIVIDSANGVTSRLAPRMFRDLGATVVEINTSIDGQLDNAPRGSMINAQDDGSVDQKGNPAKSGSQSTARLSAKIIELRDQDKDVMGGMGFDGDGDRIMFVDEDGIEIDGDGSLGAIALCLKEEVDEHGESRLKGNSVVATIMATMGLVAAMEDAGINVKLTRVGDRFVVEKMEKHGYVVGGEQSGHTILSDYQTTGDGIVTALFLFSRTLNKHQKLSELTTVKISRAYPYLGPHADLTATTPEQGSELISRLNETSRAKSPEQNPYYHDLMKIIQEGFGDMATQQEDFVQVADQFVVAKSADGYVTPNELYVHLYKDGRRAGWVSFRQSGTEPIRIRVYLTANCPRNQAEAVRAELVARTGEELKAIEGTPPATPPPATPPSTTPPTAPAPTAPAALAGPSVAPDVRQHILEQAEQWQPGWISSCVAEALLGDLDSENSIIRSTLPGAHRILNITHDTEWTERDVESEEPYIRTGRFTVTTDAGEARVYAKFPQFGESVALTAWGHNSEIDIIGRAKALRPDCYPAYKAPRKVVTTQQHGEETYQVLLVAEIPGKILKGFALEQGEGRSMSAEERERPENEWIWTDLGKEVAFYHYAVGIGIYDIGASHVVVNLEERKVTLFDFDRASPLTRQMQIDRDLVGFERMIRDTLGLAPRTADKAVAGFLRGYREATPETTASLAQEPIVRGGSAPLAATPRTTHHELLDISPSIRSFMEQPQFHGYRLANILGTRDIDDAWILFLENPTMPSENIVIKKIKDQRNNGRIEKEERILLDYYMHWGRLGVTERAYPAAVDPADGCAYLCMRPNPDGADLFTRLSRGEHFTMAQVREIGFQVARTMGHLHEMGVCIADVKPENIWICDNGRVILNDFGGAWFINSAETEHQVPTNFVQVDDYDDNGSLFKSGDIFKLCPWDVRRQMSGWAPSSDIFLLAAHMILALAGKQFDDRYEVGGIEKFLSDLEADGIILNEQWKGFFAKALGEVPYADTSDEEFTRFHTAEEFLGAVESLPVEAEVAPTAPAAPSDGEIMQVPAGESEEALKTEFKASEADRQGYTLTNFDRTEIDRAITALSAEPQNDRIAQAITDLNALRDGNMSLYTVPGGVVKAQNHFMLGLREGNTVYLDRELLANLTPNEAIEYIVHEVICRGGEDHQIVRELQQKMFKEQNYRDEDLKYHEGGKLGLRLRWYINRKAETIRIVDNLIADMGGIGVEDPELQSAVVRSLQGIVSYLQGQGMEEGIIRAELTNYYNITLNYTGILTFISSLAATAQGKETAKLIIENLARQVEAFNVADAYDILGQGAPGNRAYLAYAVVIAGFIKVSVRYPELALFTPAIVNSIFDLSWFDVMVYEAALRVANGPNQDKYSARTAGILSSIAAASDAGSRQTRQAVAALLIDDGAQHDIDLNIARDRFNPRFLEVPFISQAPEGSMPLANVTGEAAFTGLFSGDRVLGGFTIDGGEVVDLGHSDVAQFIQDRNINLVPSTGRERIFTLWTTDSILQFARDQSKSGERLRIVMSKKGDIYVAKDTGSLEIAGIERTRTENYYRAYPNVRFNLLEGTGAWIVTGFLYEYFDMNYLEGSIKSRMDAAGLPLTDITDKARDGVRDVISRRKALEGQDTYIDEAGSNFMTRAVMLKSGKFAIETIPIDFEPEPGTVPIRPEAPVPAPTLAEAGVITIGIPAFENADQIEGLIKQKLEGRNISIVRFETGDKQEDMVRRLRDQGKVGLVVDTNDVATIEKALDPLLDELDLCLLLKDHPALITGKLDNLSRTALVEIMNDGNLQKKITSSNAEYAMSNIDALALAGCEAYATYAFSAQARGLDATQPKIAVVPSALLESNPGLKARIMNRRIQMGMLEGEADPIRDVLVITDPRIKDENLYTYLNIMGISDLFDRSNIIIHGEIVQKCQDRPIPINPAALNEQQMQDIIRDILAPPQETVIDFVGGRALLVGLITGMITGVLPEQEEYYEKVIERLAHDGQIPPDIAEELNKSKGQIFKPDTVEGQRYNRELEKERQRIQEQLRTEISA